MRGEGRMNGVGSRVESCATPGVHGVQEGVSRRDWEQVARDVGGMP